MIEISRKDLDAVARREADPVDGMEGFPCLLFCMTGVRIIPTHRIDKTADAPR